jgi:hypothetical protein
MPVSCPAKSEIRSTKSETSTKPETAKKQNAGVPGLVSLVCVIAVSPF